VSARERLLESAERLLAEYGIEGVSLRQIAAASGQGNNSVVQYHFGDKAGLMREIILRRVASFEPRRRALLTAATANGREPGLGELLEILFLPIAEAVDDDGRHVYARFILHFLGAFRYQTGIDHPGWARESAATEAGVMLARRLAFLDLAAFTRRVNQVGGLFFNALIERDNAIEGGKPVEPEPAFLADLFAMMSAAIAVPPS
jgi:AcrR family transcriptional regulator